MKVMDPTSTIFRDVPATGDPVVGDIASPDLTAASVDAVELPPLLPPVRRLLKRRWLDHYKRLLLLVAVVNLTILVLSLSRWDWWTGDGVALNSVSRMVLVNLSVAVLIRQQYVINMLFRIATWAPTSWPLRLRWPLGKVYHFGGLHSGGATAATLWFTAFVGGLFYHAINGLGGVSSALVAVTIVQLAILVAMVFMALPHMRMRHHDQFELVHRFGGWTVLALFWVQTVLIASAQSDVGLLSALPRSEGFWVLILLTFSIGLPWLRLKKVNVDLVRPSSHVLLARFDHGVTPFAGSSTAVSRNPLVEWHSFANVPAPGEEGFRLTISRAGDWTGQLIDDLPEKLWVKGIPTAGVGNVDKIFKRVVWVATGSGIGPTLPHLLSLETPALLVWATRSPRETYGDGLVDEILKVQPDAIVWDTVEKGKPDMVKLAYKAVKDFDAEAVIVIANQKLTRLVVEGMEVRGIPAYGAIWDS
jgi:hypothetical protein